MSIARIVPWFFVLAAGLLILLHAIPRDVRYDKEYPGDLRSRVVGARLIKDGRMPYFYKWKATDGLRYYDPDNFDSLKISVISVSPFFLHLLSPIADQPEATISRYWLVFDYMVWAFLTTLCFFTATAIRQKQAVLLFSFLILMTNAWKVQVTNGQMYIWIPLLAGLFYACLTRRKNVVWGALAGGVAACLVLIRFNTVFFFLPFLLLLQRYPRRWIIAFCLGPLLLGGWTLLDRHERELWLDYSALASEGIKISQNLPHAWQHNQPDPHFAFWEGVDKIGADKLSATDPDPTRSENGNVFVLLQHVFNRAIPLPLLAFTGIAAIIVLFGFFYYRQRPFRYLRPEHLAIFAYCLYMLSDLFSPVFRHQYYTVQWLFPLLLTAAVLRRDQQPAFWTLLVALLLSWIHIPHLKMQNTIGEYLFLVVLLAVSLTSGRSDEQNPLPARVSADTSPLGQPPARVS